MKRSSNDHKLLLGLYFRLLPFQVLMLVINAANGIVDSLFASNFVGKTAMSAIGFYSPLNHFLFSMSIMLVSGSQLLVGKALGRNDPDEVRTYFSSDLIVSVLLSLATALLMALAAAMGVFGIFITDPEELKALNLYMLGQSVGVPALVLGQQFFSFLSIENQTKRTMLASLSCVIVNTIANTVFVYVLRMGTLGLGLGSSAGLISFCTVMALYYISGKSSMKFSPRKFSKDSSFTIIKLGYPGAISRFVEMFRCFIINIVILKFVGSGGLSSFAAINSVMAVFWAVPFGMIAVSRMLFGISIGEEDRRSVTDISRIALKQGVLLQLGISLMIAILAQPLTMLFYRDQAEEVYQMTLSGFRILPLCMPLSCISLHFSCYSQAIENKFLSHIIPILDGAVDVTVYSCLLIPLLKMNGLYFANILNGLTLLTLVVVYSIVKRRHFPKNMEDLTVLPDDFGANDDARIDIEIRQIPEVVEVSQRVMDFCSKRGIDERRSYYAALALEEMAGNVVSHGFSADNKEHFIDISVVHKDDDVILRIRDNCMEFDPTALYTGGENEDKLSDIGITIVRKISKYVQYSNLLGLNVLTIRI